MERVTRLVTYVELDDRAVTDARQLSVSARLEAGLADGRAVVLLDDRGWGESLHGGAGADIRAGLSVADIESTARMVVGPDEPRWEQTAEEMAAGHWDALAGVLREQGVAVDGEELARLPHEVVLGERLRAWLAAGPGG